MKKLITTFISLAIIISLLCSGISVLAFADDDPIEKIEYKTFNSEMDRYANLDDDCLYYRIYPFAADTKENATDLITIYYKNGDIETYYYKSFTKLITYYGGEFYGESPDWVNIDDETKIIPDSEIIISDNQDTTKWTPHGNCIITATYKNHTATVKVTLHDSVYRVVKRATTSQNGVAQWVCPYCNTNWGNSNIPKINKIVFSKTNFVYNGKVQRPKVKIWNADGVICDNEDYTVSYSKGCKNAGTYTMKITFKGNYKGSVVKHFKILPKGTTLSKLTPAKKAFTAKWSRHGAITGYQIQYATNAKFSGAKYKAVKGATKYALKVSGLKGGTKYYVRLRTYKTVGGKNYFSAWSKAKAVKTKR